MPGLSTTYHGSTEESLNCLCEEAQLWNDSFINQERTRFAHLKPIFANVGRQSLRPMRRDDADVYTIIDLITACGTNSILFVCVIPYLVAIRINTRVHMVMEGDGIQHTDWTDSLN